MTDATGKHTDEREHAPKVSVVMAIRNEEEYGPAAIQSILDQTFADFEFIIVDDASTDSTPQMLRAFAARDPRIKILTNQNNLTVPRSANRGLEIARGEYIARMDSDDYSYPHRIQEQVEFLDANPEYIIVGGGIEYIDSQNNVFRTFDRGSSWWEFEWVSFFRAPLAQPCAMFRTDVVTKHRMLYDNKFDRAADFEYWQRVLKFGYGKELPGVFVKYRWHDRNISNVFSSKQRDSAKKAGNENARIRFTKIDVDDVENLYNFLYPTAHTTDAKLAMAVRTIEKMQSEYAQEKNLTPDQTRDIRRKTAKLLIKNALDRGLHRNLKTISSFLKLITRYFPDYFSETFAIARRRLRPSRAA